MRKIGVSAWKIMLTSSWFHLLGWMQDKWIRCRMSGGWELSDTYWHTHPCPQVPLQPLVAHPFFQLCVKPHILLLAFSCNVDIDDFRITYFVRNHRKSRRSFRGKYLDIILAVGVKNLSVYRSGGAMKACGFPKLPFCVSLWSQDLCQQGGRLCSHGGSFSSSSSPRRYNKGQRCSLA